MAAQSRAWYVPVMANPAHDPVLLALHNAPVGRALTETEKEQAEEAWAAVQRGEVVSANELTHELAERRRSDG